MWNPIVSVVATLSVAVLAFAGVTHLRHQRATVPQLAASTPATRAQQSTRVRSNFGALPLAFEANQGQTDPHVKYMARGSGYTVFLTPNDTVFALHSSTAASQAAHATNVAERSRARLAQKQINASISMKLAGANSQPQIAAQNELPGRSNYFIGRDPSQWHTGVKQYSRVSYRDVYPGVDMAFHGQQRQLEFDFIVAPGASAAPIGFDVSGARKISTDADGNLVLASKAGNVLLHKPVAYQEKNNTRQPVDAAFVVQASNKIGFTLGNYDRSRELVIDPSVTYATFLGGSSDDEAYGIAIDSSGAAYVTGQTASSNFPTQMAAFGTYQGGTSDAFVTKISADGQTLEYSTYIGGTQTDGGNAIAVDGSGDAYVAGTTNSGSGSHFPITAGVVQSTPQGGFDAFVLELGTTGALTFCTYLGGSGDDFAYGVAVDTSGVYVVGGTGSTNFPDTSTGFQTAISGTSNGFVTKLNLSGTAFIYSSYLGGGTGDVANAVAVDSSNQAYVTGATFNASNNFPTKNPLQPLCSGTASGCGTLYDAFVTVVDTAGSGLVYSSFLGGTQEDQGLGIAVDGSGDAYVTGLTLSTSTSFPLHNALYGTFKGTQQAFVSEFNITSTGATAVYSTYLGGSTSQIATGIAVDNNKNAYVTGQTNSTDFPTANATQPNIGGLKDAFVTQFAPGGGSLVFSTFLGGPQDENAPLVGVALGAIAVDSSGANIYVAGNTASSTFPVTANVVQTTYGGGKDAFIAKYSTGASAGSFTIANGALSSTSGSPGVLANATITVNSTGGFNSAVTLACAISPAVTNGPTCGFTGNPVTPPANGSGTATLNVATSAAAARLNPPANGHSGMLYAMILPVFGLALVGAGFGPSGSGRRKLFGFILLGMVLTGLLILPACSSSSSGGGGGGGTPANTYTITVTGSGGGATATGSPALTLTVN